MNSKPEEGEIGGRQDSGEFPMPHPPIPPIPNTELFCEFFTLETGFFPKTRFLK
jgi:hypothetical protein